jgi:hypothetical protein
MVAVPFVPTEMFAARCVIITGVCAFAGGGGGGGGWYAATVTVATELATLAVLEPGALLLVFVITQ